MKKITLLVMVLIGTLLISACIKVESRINPDGSGTWEFGMFFSEAGLRVNNESSPSEDAETIFKLLDGESIEDTESGIVFRGEERLQNGAYWIYIIATVPDIDRWSRVPDAFQRTIITDNTDLDPLTHFFLAPKVTLNHETGMIRAEINAPSPREITSEDSSADVASAAIIQFSYEIILPGEITDHNGTIDPLTGNPIWILDFTATEPIEFYAEAKLD